MTDDTPAPGTRSEGQTFLVGPSLFLRPVELQDSAAAAIWRKQPFPAPAKVVEEQLKERLEVEPDDEERNQLLIACRRDNDQPVGSVELEIDGWRFGQLSFAVDSLASESDQAEIVAELTGILVPWMLGERHLMTVGFRDASGHSAVEQKARALSGRVAFRNREMLLINGVRRDSVYYQFFNQTWIDKLGTPPEPEFGPVERSVNSPAGSRVTPSMDDRPDDALTMGERIYLRAFKPEEGKLVSQWSLEESEIYYPEGRIIFNPHTYGEFHKKLAEQEPPKRVRFAIVLRDTGELIGCNGLDNISWVHSFAETETEIFRPEHRSAGLGTEAKHLLLEYAFDRLGMHMIYSFVAETNTRSAAALRKQGYRDAGYIGWDSFSAGGLCGYLSFDLLASEWRAAREQQSPAKRS